MNVFIKTCSVYNVSKLRRYIHTPFTVATTRCVWLDVTGILYSENRYRTYLPEQYIEPSMARRRVILVQKLKTTGPVRMADYRLEFSGYCGIMPRSNEP
jgi:hypothetical protein